MGSEPIHVAVRQLRAPPSSAHYVEVLPDIVVGKGIWSPDAPARLALARYQGDDGRWVWTYGIATRRAGRWNFALEWLFGEPQPTRDDAEARAREWIGGDGVS